MFLVVSDYYYREFIEVEELKENTFSQTVIEKLAEIFAVHGIPEKLITDNGPQFISHSFKEFVYQVGVSAHYHQSAPPSSKWNG